MRFFLFPLWTLSIVRSPLRFLAFHIHEKNREYRGFSLIIYKYFAQSTIFLFFSGIPITNAA